MALAEISIAHEVPGRMRFRVPALGDAEVDPAYLEALAGVRDVRVNRGGRIVIGSRHYLEEHEGVSFAAHQPLIRRLEDEGKTLLYVGSEQGPVGVIALRDTLRADAAATLARLRELGVERLVLMTGDRRAKAEALAAELGLDEVHAEMRPEEKAGVITRLQGAGRKVAFVGDGVNDGPALAQAEVGIAPLHNGTTIGTLLRALAGAGLSAPRVPAAAPPARPLPRATH